MIGESRKHTVKVDIPTLESVGDVIQAAHYPQIRKDATYAISAELAQEIGLLLWDYEQLRSALRTALEETTA